MCVPFRESATCVQRNSNVKIVFDELANAGVVLTHTSGHEVRPEDITDGDPATVLDVLWLIFERLCLKSVQYQGQTGKQALLKWVADSAQAYPGVPQSFNYQDSYVWTQRTGLVFCGGEGRDELAVVGTRCRGSVWLSMGAHLPFCL